MKHQVGLEDFGGAKFEEKFFDVMKGIGFSTSPSHDPPFLIETPGLVAAP